MTPITISGVGLVSADSVIDGLLAKIAELTLENVGLRALCGHWESLAHANVVDGAPEPLETSTGVVPA